MTTKIAPVPSTEDSSFRIHDYPIMEMGHAVARVQARIVAAIGDPLITASVWRVLAILGESPWLSTKELARRAILERPATSRIIDRLDIAGLIQREGNPSDGRSMLLALSPKGDALYQRAAAAAKIEMERAVSGLSPAQMAQFRSLLSKIAAER